MVVAAPPLGGRTAIFTSAVARLDIKAELQRQTERGFLLELGQAWAGEEA